MNKNGTQKNQDIDLKTFALAYNFLRIFSDVTYGTKSDFIKDKLQDCLNKGIITEEIANDNFWEQNSIIIHNCDFVDMDSPYGRLTYSVKEDNDSRKWPFNFKKIILPNGWYMKKGCDCGRNMDPASFTIFNEKDQCLKTFAYFLNTDYEDENFSKIETFFDPLDHNI